MKKIFLIGFATILFACNNDKQQKVNDAIEQTSDSLVSKLNKANDTLRSAADSLKDKLPKIAIETYKEVPITLQWIAFESSEGKAKIKNTGNGWYTISGEQTNSANEYLKINGKLKRLDANNVSFEGTIITYVKANNGGKPCEKNGKQTFAKKGDRRYYRLQQMTNCEGGRLVDYVDIYDLDQVI